MYAAMLKRFPALAPLVVALLIMGVLLRPLAATEALKVLGQAAPGISSGTVTCTNASPMVCTLTGSSAAVGDQFQFASGTPPTGTALLTTYFVITAGLTANAFELSTTLGGSAINSSSTGSALVGKLYRVFYTVPGATSTVISSLTAANDSASTNDAVIISVQPACAGWQRKYQVAPGVAAPFNDTLILTLGITMATTDCITVHSANGTTIFNAYGSEVQ